MKGWILDLVNFIFPAECHICDCKLAPHEEFLCAKCISELPRTGFHRQDLNPMAERFAGLFPFERATGLFFYNRGSALSQVIQDMKYRSFPGIGILLGKIAARELLSTGFFNDIEYVVPVPMHWMKKARRGYNQAEMIARGLCEETGMKLYDALKMTRSHKTQTRLSREERMKNATNLFKLSKESDLIGKGVLLVDDVCTTGTTMAEAGRTLYNSCKDIKLSLLTIGVTF